MGDGGAVGVVVVGVVLEVCFGSLSKCNSSLRSRTSVRSCVSRERNLVLCVRDAGMKVGLRGGDCMVRWWW